MTNAKFDETDRGAVVSALERNLRCRLVRVGSRRKWLRDELGRNYWILGGYGEWHGVPQDMMESEIQAPSGGYIVVAIRHRSAVQIYVGVLRDVIDNRAKLYRAAKTTGDYQFTLRKRGSQLIVEQASSVILDDLTGFSFAAHDKESVARVEATKRAFGRLSISEKEKLIAELKDKR